MKTTTNTMADLVFDITSDAIAEGVAMKSAQARSAERGWGHRFLPRFKTVDGKRYQLHATRGWKCIGRAAA